MKEQGKRVVSKVKTIQGSGWQDMEKKAQTWLDRFNEVLGQAAKGAVGKQMHLWARQVKRRSEKERPG